MTIQKIIVGVVLLTLAIGIGIGWLLFHNDAQSVPKNISAPTSAPPVASPPPAAPKEPSIADRFAKATVRKREGIEHPLIRQLVDDPTLITGVPKHKGLALEPFTGDRKDLKAVEQWAGRQAHLAAIGTRKVSLHFGAQIYVRVPDSIAYVFQKDADGSLSIAEYMVTTPGPGQAFAPKLMNTRVVAADVSQAEFLSNPGSSQTIPSYEYLFAGRAG